MKLFKQDYISFDGSGSFVTASGDARESVVDDADVAYRLSRIAEEERERMTADGTAPNAVDAADMSAYTGVGSQHAQAPLIAQAGRGPRRLLLRRRPQAARGKAAKRTIMAVQDAGMVACVACTDDKRADAALRAADAKVSLGEKHLDALYSNGYAVLKAAEEADAQVILLIEDAQALSGVDTFLARAAAAGRRVFTQLGDSPQLGWVLCTTDKTDEVCGAWRTCKHCKLTFDGASLAAGHYVCPSCGGYLRMTSDERIDDLLDSGTFQEWDRVIEQTDPLGFPGYLDKLEAQRGKTGLEEGVRTGRAHRANAPHRHHGVHVLHGVHGQCGGGEGHAPVRACHRRASAGDHLHRFGRRAACRRVWSAHADGEDLVRHRASCRRASAVHLGHHRSHHRRRHRVVCHGRRHHLGRAQSAHRSPGQRVIRDTIRQELPEGFQTAEFALEHGLIDAIVERQDLRATLAHILAMHLSTACQATGCAHNAGDHDVLVSYRAVCDNLENGTATYNTVTYSDLRPEPMSVEERAVWEKLREAIPSSLIPESLRAGASRRVERAIAAGTFDAEAGTSLEVGATSVVAAASPDEQENRAWQSVQLARNVHRPTAISYIRSFVDGFVELHGDRGFADDGAIVGGIGWIGGRAVTVIGQEKGENLKERIRRNFGCPQPEGYRKALRLMRQAEKFRRPIVALPGHPGVYCGPGGRGAWARQRHRRQPGGYGGLEGSRGHRAFGRRRFWRRFGARRRQSGCHAGTRGVFGAPA